MDLLQKKQFTCSVSSVLNKNIKSYGKQFLYDQEEDTAWYSDKGKGQFISIQFTDPQAVSAFEVQFQGGFAGTEIVFTLENENGQCLGEEKFWPDDINAVQHFELKNTVIAAKKVKIEFNKSSDFFGRIIIYKLKIFA